MRATRRLAVAAGLPAAALLLAGCSEASPRSPGASVPHAAAQVRGGGGGAALEFAPSDGSTQGGSASALAPVQDTTPGQAKQTDTSGPSLGIAQGRIERSVTATFVVPHGGFLAAFDQLIARAVALGGYVLSSSTAPDQSGRVDGGTLSVRVPAAKLNQMVTGTPRDWRTSSIDYASVDHTAETVDLVARLRAATAHRDALQGLLAGTHDLQSITALEQQIAQVQQEVEQDQGAVDAVDDRVDMATASIALHEQGAVTPAAPAPTPRLLSALRDGAANAVAVIAALAEGVLSALPLLVLAAIALLVAWRTRRLGRRRSEQAVP
jgi:hypothetical protein